MPRNHNEPEKSSKLPTRTDGKRQNEDRKAIPRQQNSNNAGSSQQSTEKSNKSTDGHFGNKKVIPPIGFNRREESKDDDNNEQDFEIIDKGSLPLKLFDGKKQSLNELSEESMSYLWLRRIKEIFLHMADGKDEEEEDDPFIEFNMNLARTDLTNTCDRYIENERLALKKKDSSATTKTKTGQKSGSAQSMQDCIKELNELITNPSSGDLPTILNKCIESLQEFDKNTHEIIDKLRKQQISSSDLNAQNILQLIQSSQMTEGKKEKSELEKTQEWDMKKLYAEVFKMSYKRNRLITDDEKEELTPKKKGNDQPNFGNAIWWYSCDNANIYYQINSILRLENFELLMSYRYYLSDLCRMIEFMYKKRKDEYGDIAQTFYRAGNINKKQLEQMSKSKQQKGQFISLVGFISTTTDPLIAKGYARKQHISKENERVLFQINIKPQEPCTAFAYIEDISFHPEEKEVLFSMGSTFTVDKIVPPENGENYHTIHLTASEIDKTLVDDICTKVENCSPSGRAVLLAQYLMELGEYRAARKYLNSLLDQACDGGILINDPSLASIYCCLGMTYARQGLYGDAIKSFKQALNTQARLEYSNNNVLAHIHNNIGLAYVGLGHMDEAEATLSEAVRIQLRELNSNQQHLAEIYSNIGYVHYKKSNFSEAEDAFSEAEKIYKKSSSKIAHDALEQTLIKAEYLTNYGHLLTVHKSSTDAQERYNDALKLYKSILPDGDPKLMQTHINIMLAYAQNENYDKVTKWYEDLRKENIIEKQEINMFELNSSVTQASLAFLHELVGACYAIEDSFDKAIDLWVRSLVFKRKARLEQLLFETTNSISSTLIVEQNTFIQKGYRLACEYYMKPNDAVNKSTDDTIKQLPKEFCLGLIYAELYNHDKATECLIKAIPNLGQSNKDMLFITHLLLADIYKHQRQYTEAIDNLNSALEEIKSLETQKDRVLEIEVKLIRSECSIHANPGDAIDKLLQLGSSLKSNDTDTKRISLKVIVYDTLAQYCLKQKNYDRFDDIAEKSKALKLRSFSPYHPSLAINFIQIAKRHIQQHPPRYREALDSYEHALEIQSLNLTDNHPKIRKICYAIGDIYCKLDKLSNAMEKYDVAENKNLNVDEDDVFQQDKINSEESMDILMARISMYRHLAEFHAKKQVYKEAIPQINEIIDLLKAELPSGMFETSDETIFMQKNIDASTLIVDLQQLADCHLYLGDILGSNQDDDHGYQAALDIIRKLYQHDENLTRDKFIALSQKLSKYYEELDENEEALETLQNIVDLKQPTIAIRYRLGLLNIACDELNEAITNYQDMLSDQSIKDEKYLKKIIQDKLNEVQKKLEEQKRRSSTSSQSDQNTSDDAVGNTSNKLSRNPTNISTTSHHENEIDPDTVDYQAIAAAYLRLEDVDKSIKFYEKDIRERTKSVKYSNIFQIQLQQIEQAAYMYEQQNILILLPKLLHSVITKIRETISLENSDLLQLADSYFQCALLYDQSFFHLKSLVNYIPALSIYISKSANKIEKLINDMNTILNSFVECKLKSEDIIKVCKQYLPPDDIVRMRLKIAAMYRDDQIDDVEDTDDHNNTSNESTALQHYKNVLNDTNDVLAKGVCYYNILSLYKDFICEDDAGKAIVDGMINWIEKFTTSDRRLLITLALDFLKNYDDIRDICDKKSNDQWQKIVKKYSGEKRQVDVLNIGKYLIELNDFEQAEKYWNLIIEQLEIDIPNRVLSLVHDPYSTFDQILNIIKQPQNDNIALFRELADTYEIAGDYYQSEGENSQSAGTESFRQAESMYQKAVYLLKQLKVDIDKINKVEKKQQKAKQSIK